MGTRYDSLTQIIKAQRKPVSALKKTYDGSFVDGKATDSTKRLANQLQDANGKLTNYKTTVTKYQERLLTIKSEMKV